MHHGTPAPGWRRLGAHMVHESIPRRSCFSSCASDRALVPSPPRRGPSVCLGRETSSVSGGEGAGWPPLPTWGTRQMDMHDVPAPGPHALPNLLPRGAVPPATSTPGARPSCQVPAPKGHALRPSPCSRTTPKGSPHHPSPGPAGATPRWPGPWAVAPLPPEKHPFSKGCANNDPKAPSHN